MQNSTDSASDHHPSPEVDQNKLVVTQLKVYDEMKDESGKVQAFLVGVPGLYNPRHRDHMTWLPMPLVTRMEPLPGGTTQFTIPYWLAAKKGLAILDGYEEHKDRQGRK